MMIDRHTDKWKCEQILTILYISTIAMLRFNFPFPYYILFLFYPLFISHIIHGWSIVSCIYLLLTVGIGLQLTNILRDVGEDLERGRIYLPLDEIHQFGLTEDDLFR